MLDFHGTRDDRDEFPNPPELKAESAPIPGSGLFQCTLCPKIFTRAYNLRSHFRTHTDERPFVCTVCGKTFARNLDRKRHKGLYSEKKFVSKGDMKDGSLWGCGRRFARADALGMHLRSEAGCICIIPLLEEEIQAWQAAAVNSMLPQPIGASIGADASNADFYSLPAEVLAKYLPLSQMSWGPSLPLLPPPQYIG
jgi:hypothetical protein